MLNKIFAASMIALSSYSLNAQDSTFADMGQIDSLISITDTKYVKGVSNIQSAVIETINGGDLVKSLQSRELGYYAPIAHAAIGTKDNISNENFGTYLEMNDSYIPVLGSNTNFHDVLFAYDEDILNLDLKGSAYSTNKSSLGSTLLLSPKKFDENNMKISSDLIKRKIVANLSTESIKTKFLVGNTGVPKNISSVIKGLKLFPKGVSLQNYSQIQKNDLIISSFFNITNEEASLTKKDEQIRGITRLEENNSKKLIAIASKYALDEINSLNFAASYQKNISKLLFEFEDREEKWSVLTNNIHLSSGLFGYLWNTSITYDKLINGLNGENMTKEVVKLNAEKNFIFNNFLIQTSGQIAFVGSLIEKSQAMSATYFNEIFGKQFELKAGFGKYFEPLVTNNSSVENSLVISDLVNKKSTHYSFLVSAKINEPLLRDLSLEYYNKLITDISKKNRIWVEGINLQIQNDYFNLKYSHSLNSQKDGFPLVGAVDDVFQIESKFELYKGLYLSARLSMDSGFYDKIYNENSYDLNYSNKRYIKNSGKSNLDIGLTKSIYFLGEKLDCNLMLGNLGSILFNEPQVVRTVKTTNGLEQIYSPTIINIGISWNGEI